MNLKRMMQIWFLIAVMCCLLTVPVAGLAIYTASHAPCQANMLSSEHSISRLEFFAVMSIFLVNVFRVACSDKSIADANKIANSVYKEFHVISNHIPITAVHLILYLPIAIFCILTLLPPVLSFIYLHYVNVACGCYLAIC